MYCFTLKIGEAPVRGIRIGMDSRMSVPGILVGSDKDGIQIPCEVAWFNKMVELDHQTLELPELKGSQLPLPIIMNADLREVETGQKDDEGHPLVECQMVGRPGSETDRRALVHVIPPDGARARFSGCYKIESMVDAKVSRGYPGLEHVPGVSVVAHINGEALLVLHPNAAFRATLPRSTQPNLFMYRLTSTGSKTRLIDLTPKREAA